MVLLTHEKLSKICQDNILLSKPIWKSSLISKKFKIIRGFQFFLSSSSFLCGFFGFRTFSSMLSISFSMFLMSTFEGIIIEFFISFDQFRRSYGAHCLKIAINVSFAFSCQNIVYFLEEAFKAIFQIKAQFCHTPFFEF